MVQENLQLFCHDNPHEILFIYIFPKEFHEDNYYRAVANILDHNSFKFICISLLQINIIFMFSIKYERIYLSSRNKAKTCIKF